MYVYTYMRSRYKAQQILTDRVIFNQTPQPQKELRAGFEAVLASEKRRWKKRLLEERQVADEALEAAQVRGWGGGWEGGRGGGFGGRRQFVFPIYSALTSDLKQQQCPHNYYPAQKLKDRLVALEAKKNKEKKSGTSSSTTTSKAPAASTDAATAPVAAPVAAPKAKKEKVAATAAAGGGATTTATKEKKAAGGAAAPAVGKAAQEKKAVGSSSSSSAKGAAPSGPKAPSIAKVK